MTINVLLVDDSEMVRAMIAKCFTLAEIPVKELFQAANGKEALVTLKEKSVDLIFTDINMPEMDGVELINHIFEDQTLCNIPVVVVSTEGSQTRIQALKEKGIRDYLRKPFTPERIKEIVDHVQGEKNV